MSKFVPQMLSRMTLGLALCAVFPGQVGRKQTYVEPKSRQPLNIRSMKTNTTDTALFEGEQRKFRISGRISQVMRQDREAIKHLETPVPGIASGSS